MKKEDKNNHGFGTRNVKACVSKNEGTVDFEYTETKFRATITLVNAIQKYVFLLKKRNFMGKMSFTAKQIPLTAELLEKGLACVSLKTQAESFFDWR